MRTIKVNDPEGREVECVAVRVRHRDIPRWMSVASVAVPPLHAAMSPNPAFGWACALCPLALAGVTGRCGVPCGVASRARLIAVEHLAIAALAELIDEEKP